MLLGETCWVGKALSFSQELVWLEDKKLLYVKILHFERLKIRGHRSFVFTHSFVCTRYLGTKVN